MSDVVIAAVEPGEVASAILRAARSAATELAARVRVLTALEPLPMLPSDHPAAAPMQVVQLERIRELHDRLRAETSTLSDEERPSFDMVVGPAARTICEAAESWSSSLIVMGIGSHARVDRVFGGETAVRVARSAPVPVLAIQQDTPPRPKNVVIGVDFSEAARRAADLALRIACPGAVVHLVHVRPRFLPVPADDAEWIPVYTEGAGKMLDALAREMHERRPDVRLAPVVLGGHPARELLAMADRVDPDWMVVGQHGRGPIDRLLLGSVATTLLREATFAVLVAPPARKGAGG
jgi:nucleotide-binding universal stress UspA family protein